MLMSSFSLFQHTNNAFEDNLHNSTATKNFAYDIERLQTHVLLFLRLVP
jgi:hypothetical protein